MIFHIFVLKSILIIKNKYYLLKKEKINDENREKD